MHVLFLAAEAEPFVKIGGLADVAGALPVAIHQISRTFREANKIDIRMALPFHYAIKQNGFLPKFLGEFLVKKGELNLNCQVYHSTKDGVPVYFIDGLPLNGKTIVYSRNSEDDGDKFIFFSLAALQLAEVLEWPVHILHTNDWHTAPAIAALKTHHKSSRFLSSTKALHTLHNLPFMGKDNEKTLAEYGLLPNEDSNLPNWARHVPLPLGLSYADKIIVVSPNYASEIMTEVYGCGLEGFLRERKHIIGGILNGIDTAIWDPNTDPFITHKFTEKSIEKRRFNKRFLLHRYNLPEIQDAPLLILISRMDQQKGIDIALQSLLECEALPWQAILLGSGDPLIENLARDLEKKYPQRVRTFIEFNTPLAHQLYAGGDILMMPSRFEPCGLTQMIAMRYGCIPLATSTGGLKNTIIPVGDDYDSGTGFLFEQPNPSHFSATLKQAIKTYQNPDQWRRIQVNAMQTDFSWSKSALKYIHEYMALLAINE